MTCVCLKTSADGAASASSLLAQLALALKAKIVTVFAAAQVLSAGVSLCFLYV